MIAELRTTLVDLSHETYKGTAREATQDGCDSETANMLKEHAVKNLQVPKLIQDFVEIQEEFEAE